MQLWEIKAQALKLMFSDSDIQFSEEEFTDGTIYANANTGEKLVRMTDSIKRAINFYYFYVGTPILFDDFVLDTTISEGVTTYYNTIDCSTTSLFLSPSKIDAYVYSTYTDSDGAEQQVLQYKVNDVEFSYNPFTKKIHFIENDYRDFEDDIMFKIWYRTEKTNITDAWLDTTDLDTLYIPEDVQLMIPYYVKGELYEEDEPNLAMLAKQEYMQFLYQYPKQFVKKQTKVRRAKIFEKTN